MNTRNPFKLGGLAAAVAVAVGGCNDAGNQDSGQSDQVQVSGVVADGYVAGGTVYVDVNGNREIDSFEPKAKTDRYGFYSYRPELKLPDGSTVEARNYCNESSEDFSERYCLRVSNAHDGATIRMRGGYDLLTGEPFQGGMSRKVDIPDGDSTDVAAGTVNPLTSIRSGENDTPEDAKDVGEFWGGDADGDGTYEWNTDVESNDLKVALQLHKVVDVLVNGLTSMAEAQGVTSDTLTEAVGPDLSPMLYRGLRDVLAGGSEEALGSIDISTLTESDIEGIMEDWLATANQELAELDGTDAQLTDDGQLAELAGVASELLTAVDTAFDSGSGTKSLTRATDADAEAAARASEVATAVGREDARDEGSGSDSGSSGNRGYGDIASGVRAELDATDDGGRDVDVRDLAEKTREARDGSGLPSDYKDLVNSSTVSARLPELSGTVLALSAEGTATNDAGDSGNAKAAIQFYFQEGAINAAVDYADSGWYNLDDSGDHARYVTQGPLTLCVATGGEIDFDFGDDENKDTYLLEGSWERISDRSVLLSIAFGGEQETMNLRVRGASNELALNQYYNPAMWEDGSPAGTSGLDGSGTQRSNYWKGLSGDYWDNTASASDYLSPWAAALDLSSEERFDFSGDRADTSETWDRAQASGDGGWNTGDGNQLTPRGWVFDVSYDGDDSVWDVEQTRDEVLADTSECNLRLLEAISASDVPNHAQECSEQLSQ